MAADIAGEISEKIKRLDVFWVMASTKSPSRFAGWIPKISALILIGLTGWMTYRREAPRGSADQLVRQFAFEKSSLDDVDPAEVESEKPLLAPRFQHLEGYLTAFTPTGAAIFDLDQDGYFDEACTTDAFSRKLRVHQLPVGGNALVTIELPLPKSAFGRGGLLPSGCLPGDFNHDGKTDLLVYFWGRTPVVYLNDAGRLSADNFRIVEVIDPPQRWYTQSMASGDVDGDGTLDLVAANYFPDQAKILDDDFEGDSLMNKGMGAAFNGAVNRLLLGQRSNRAGLLFVEAKDVFASDELGGSQWTIATALTDLDGDLLPEVFFLNDHGADRILHNRTRDGKLDFVLLQNERDFVTPKSSTFGRDDFHAMGVDFADLNQDGHLDWVISNFGADYLFHQSHFVWIHSGEQQLFEQGRAPFRDESESWGLARTSGVPWDVRCADFNNDGTLEVYRSVGFMRGTVNRMPEIVEMALVNDLVFQYPEVWHKFGPDDSLVGEIKANAFCVHDGDRYRDIGRELGMIEPGNSRGMSSADVDRDGRVDFLVTNQRASSTFYHNQSPAGAFVGLDIRLPYDAGDPNRIELLPGIDRPGRPSRPAIGAAVKLNLPNGKVEAGVVDGGSGYGGKKSPVLHFGLGHEDVPEELDLEISWRDLQGSVHHRSIRVRPGWQTLWLGSESSEAAGAVAIRP